MGYFSCLGTDSNAKGDLLNKENIFQLRSLIWSPDYSLTTKYLALYSLIIIREGH